MQAALDLACRGEGRTRPNPPVGAVVVRDQKIIGGGYHPRAGDPHAEVFALQEAGDKARGADLYVTLEPCCHTGRTGPCTAAIIRAGIARVFIGTRDPNPKVAGRGVAKLQSAGIEVTEGILEDACRDLIAPFARHMTTGLPLVIHKGAITLDGFTATRSGDSRWVSSPESREQVHRLRDRVDAIMVGIGTVLADNPRLTTRLPEGGRSADRIVVDSKLQIPEDAPLLALDDGVQTLIATTAEADPEKVERLQRAGATILRVAADAAGQVDLTALCRELGRRDYLYVLLEGGSRLASGMWRSGLVQRVQIYVAPKFYAGDDGVHLFAGAGPKLMADSRLLTNVRYRQCGCDMVVEGDVSSCLPV
ncbi:MAG: bifunctional diaminohydroxyphosphoribosylaminopyrimidine deaminase/5-amino-6-(5-phosphoribosylamino)uracil reductase RibD [Desulfuromonas sp.]|nr:MAG: bifunctional diaminohydroxyphosphoribosylaminopyrimidine deaminase/5-amino-6-(5-phosphoribosylamino)uracil reductase RibD [Desulfuromonas sp.]